MAESIAFLQSDTDSTPDLDNIDLETANKALICKYVIYKFHQYEEINAKDQSLWDVIQVDFKDFEERHFAQLTGSIWKIVKDCCYPCGYWIDQNHGPGMSRQAIMVKAVAAEWRNNKWNLGQIQWVEVHYGTLSRMTKNRKQELTGVTFSSPVHIGRSTSSTRPNCQSADPASERCQVLSQLSTHTSTTKPISLHTRPDFVRAEYQKPVVTRAGTPGQNLQRRRQILRDWR